MAIKTMNSQQIKQMQDRPNLARLRRKADQHWEMAGLARQDRDTADEKKHTDLARQYEQEIRDNR